MLMLFKEKEKEMKRKIIAELPRRTSDRIALKAQREEQVMDGGREGEREGMEGEGEREGEREGVREGGREWERRRE